MALVSVFLVLASVAAVLATQGQQFLLTSDVGAMADISGRIASWMYDSSVVGAARVLGDLVLP